jgi:hypothetical protein
MRFIFAGGGTTIVAPSWYKGIEYVPGSCETNGRVYANCEITGDTVRLAGRGVVLTNLDQTEALAPNVYLRPIGSNRFLFYELTD